MHQAVQEHTIWLSMTYIVLSMANQHDMHDQWIHVQKAFELVSGLSRAEPVQRFLTMVLLQL